MSVLAPAPNLARGRLDWDRIGAAYAEEVTGLAAARCGLPGDAEILHVTTPADWKRQGMIAGTPFSLAHTFAQTGPFRPANLPRTTDNVVLAGCGTVPGVGIPTALLSGRLAADRVTGAGGPRARRRYRGPVSGRELDAAGITDPRLRAAYARCRTLNARHGRTFFLAARLLPPSRRPAIHALYGFARHADDLVDEPAAGRGPAEIADRLDHLAAALEAGLRTGRSEDPVLAAVVDTADPVRASAARCSPPSCARCGWTSPSPTTRHGPRSGSTRAARPR